MGSERVLGDTESSDEVVPSAARRSLTMSLTSRQMRRAGDVRRLHKAGAHRHMHAGAAISDALLNHPGAECAGTSTPYCNNYRVAYDPVASAHMTTTCVKPLVKPIRENLPAHGPTGWGEESAIGELLSRLDGTLLWA